MLKWIVLILSSLTLELQDFKMQDLKINCLSFFLFPLTFRVPLLCLLTAFVFTTFIFTHVCCVH